MRTAFSALIVGMALASGAWLQAKTDMQPDSYIKLTAFSERILLVDVQEVKFRITQTGGGLESREVTVIGTKVETIRGNDVEKNFISKSDETRIVDRAEANRRQTSEVVDLLNEEAPHRPSACLSGHRYLVIYLSEMTIFFEVSRDDEKWREQVMELQEDWKTGDPSK